MYPPLIKLDDATLARLRSYLNDELNNHYLERVHYMKRLENYQRDYYAEPMTQQTTFPFTGASQVVIPLTAIAIEAVHSRTMTTLFGLPQVVSAKAKSNEWLEAEHPIERFLDNEIQYDGRNYKALDSALLELTKFGTGIGRASYEKIVKKAIRSVRKDPEDENSEVVEEEFKVTTKQGCVLEAVSNGRFLMPFVSQDAQIAGWCGEEHPQTQYDVKCLAESGFYYKDVYDRLNAWFSNASLTTGTHERKFESVQEELEQKIPVWQKALTITALYVTFDVDGDGEDEEIFVHYHRDSQEFAAIRYNYFNNLRRPYRKGNYFPVEHRWTGIGICKQNEQFQLEITTMHRQRLDVGTVTIAPMIVIHKNSGIDAQEPTFPGKQWFVNDMTHIAPFNLRDVQPSAFANENSTLLYSQQRTGVNEVTLGMPQAGTPGTATSDLARIQEGNKRFDYTYKNIKLFTKELFIDMLDCYRQFGSRRLVYYDMKDQVAIKKFFDMPADAIEDNILIEIAPAGQQQNKIADRNNYVQQAQLLQQYYTGLIQLAELAFPQLLPEISKQGIVAATEMMRQVLETFDARAIDRILFTLTPETLAVLQQGGLLAPTATGSNGSANPGASGNNQNNGLGALGEISKLLGAGGASVAPGGR